jgi:hypothetical protein
MRANESTAQMGIRKKKPELEIRSYFEGSSNYRAGPINLAIQLICSI